MSERGRRRMDQRSYGLYHRNGRQMREHQAKPTKIAFFGHFDSTNFGNESTLAAILHHLRRFHPEAEVTCISTGPEATVASHHIEAISVGERFLNSLAHRNTL